MVLDTVKDARNQFLLVMWFCNFHSGSKQTTGITETDEQFIIYESWTESSQWFGDSWYLNIHQNTNNPMCLSNFHLNPPLFVLPFVLQLFSLFFLVLSVSFISLLLLSLLCLVITPKCSFSNTIILNIKRRAQDITWGLSTEFGQAASSQCSHDDMTPRSWKTVNIQ